MWAPQCHYISLRRLGMRSLTGVKAVKDCRLYSVESKDYPFGSRHSLEYPDFLIHYLVSVHSSLSSSPPAFLPGQKLRRIPKKKNDLYLTNVRLMVWFFGQTVIQNTSYNKMACLDSLLFHISTSFDKKRKNTLRGVLRRVGTDDTSPSRRPNSVNQCTLIAL